MKYLVKRIHEGDRLYRPGDIREAAPASVKHLVTAGILEQQVRKSPEKKAGSAPETKARRAKSDG